MSQAAIEDYLMLPITCDKMHLSFHNKRSFLRKIDALPDGPRWICEQWEIQGDTIGEDGEMKTKEIELWRRDPVECIHELIGNPSSVTVFTDF
ncbi:hypothetical protein BN946_scf184779.g2 [Trametes cinnabarina]|uniref:Uncharacterized protein n=1 Tax=Pycnoporus cinnabarinus TaxID=5643 RepID=A0A060SEH1_PYCCI|nr:hypothetical protein BN946_scf184779.g2 [Trametes cinnabarina]